MQDQDREAAGGASGSAGPRARADGQFWQQGHCFCPPLPGTASPLRVRRSHIRLVCASNTARSWLWAYLVRYCACSKE